MQALSSRLAASVDGIPYNCILFAYYALMCRSINGDCNCIDGAIRRIVSQYVHGAWA